MFNVEADACDYTPHSTGSNCKAHFMVAIQRFTVLMVKMKCNLNRLVVCQPSLFHKKMAPKIIIHLIP
jgi:hypothetical protein